MDIPKQRADIIVIFTLVTITSMFYYILVLNTELDKGNKIFQHTGEKAEIISLNQDGENSEGQKIKSMVLIDAPIIMQYPELPRGCEVTSLAMLLQYNGTKVGKMELAKKVAKSKTPLIKENGKISWGDPNEGFIGDMYSLNNPGYGVYHQPIYELAEKYLPEKTINLTGSEFKDLQRFLSQDKPVWVITNTTYKKLPDKAFQSWKTPNGHVEITNKEHSVLITGYDEKNVFFNDPLSGVKNKREPIKEFIEAWEQMGRQAISLR